MRNKLITSLLFFLAGLVGTATITGCGRPACESACMATAKKACEVGCKKLDEAVSSKLKNRKVNQPE